MTMLFAWSSKHVLEMNWCRYRYIFYWVLAGVGAKTVCWLVDLESRAGNIPEHLRSTSICSLASKHIHIELSTKIIHQDCTNIQESRLRCATRLLWQLLGATFHFTSALAQTSLEGSVGTTQWWGIRLPPSFPEGTRNMSHSCLQHQQYKTNHSC